MKRYPTRAMLTLALVLSLIFEWVEMGAAATPMAGKIVQLQGQVSVRPAGGKAWQPAVLQQEIHEGDAIQTGPVSRAAILCVDESQIKLNENTIFVLTSAAPSARLGWGAAVPAAAARIASLYQVPQGEIWLRNSNEKFRFELETPALTAAVRGTEFNLRVARDGFTVLALLAGSLVLRNPQGEISLFPGEEGLARPGEAPTKRVLVQPADAVQWSLAYPGIISYRDLPLTQTANSLRAPGGPPAVAALVVQAEASYDQGRLGQAREEAERILQMDRHNARALSLLGWISLQRHDPEAAVGLFRQVREPDEAAVVGLALALYRQQEVLKAYDLMIQAGRQLKPTPLLTTMTGYFALMAGQVAPARKLLESARAQEPSAVLPLALLAQIALVQNRKAEAQSLATQAVAVNPKSPAALVTLGLVNLAHFDQNTARQHLERALAADPACVDAYIYLARIWLGSDYLHRARDTIDTALRLAPNEAEVLSMAGFIRIGFRDYKGAKVFFDRAVKANPNFGDPHIGLGHYHFRFRAFEAGLTEILTGTLLEPRISLFQSFLGKALYQMRVFDKALDTYDYAKTLDPKDPTPYLYKGIALTDLNRPGEAIEELNRSVDLNDNQAIFRSRLMLDRDLAVRNFNLAYAYNNLGLGTWGYSKALTAVKRDPTNSSAQLFLANAFAGTRQRVGASTSAFLLYKLLSPANQNTFSLGIDYTPMFEMPYARTLASATVGIWDSKDQNLQKYSLEGYGGLPGVAGDVFGSWIRDKGYRRFNADSRSQFLSGLFKWDATPKTSLFCQSLYYDRELGDALYLGDYFYRNKPYYRQFSSQLGLEGGLVHRFSPGAILLAYMNYTKLTTRMRDYAAGSGSFPMLLGPYSVSGWDNYQFYDRGSVSYDTRSYSQDKNEYHCYNPQVQQMLLLGKHTLLVGADYFRGKGEYNYSDLLQIWYRRFTYANETLIYDPGGHLIYEGPFWGPYVVPLSTRSLIPSFNSFYSPKWSYSFYLLDYWKLTPKLLVELGGIYKATKNSNLRVERNIKQDLWSPRVGINYYLTPKQIIRVGAYTAISGFGYQSSLMPSEVAGVPYDINAFEGAEVREAGASWEAQWSRRTFTSLRLGALRVSSPQITFQKSPIEYFTWKGYYANVSLNQILSPYLGLHLGGGWKRFDSKYRNDPDFTEINGLARLTFWHASGLRAYVAANLINQDPKKRADDLFVLADAGVGYEFPGKRGLVFLNVSNIFNRHFQYLMEPIRLDLLNASRQITLKMALYF
ncbi:MAG: tetratricopeptide repeat protein [Desulfobaccales bacterium]